jgi:hypothetical protein
LSFQRNEEALSGLPLKVTPLPEAAAIAAESNLILARALQANANTGIGLFREIALLTDACADEGVEA